MQFISELSILRYFDVSIIIPIYKNVADFKRVLPLNQAYFQRNGIEVVLVMEDAAEENELIAFLDNYPCVNWKVIPGNHSFGQYSRGKALNAGIRNADNRFVMMLEPSMELFTDVIYQLRYTLEHYSESFALGAIITAGYGKTIDKEQAVSYSGLPYGCLMAQKKIIEETGGYAESPAYANAADENIYARLELSGKKRMRVPQAISIYRHNGENRHTVNNSFEQPEAFPLHMLYPKKIFINDDAWGYQSGELRFHWKYNKSTSHRQNLLNRFDEYWLASPDVFEKEFALVCLIQVRNEIDYIPGVLKHLDSHCDGIILLDDGSTDNSYEQAFSDKLLLKVKKKYKGYFDDLENRNLLLQLGHLFKVDWFFSMDADERFDERYPALNSLIRSDLSDTMLFRLVHLWNDEKWYRKDVPQSMDGIILRYRMFKNKGFLQILVHRELHFSVSPFTVKANRVEENVLILHYGLMHEATRKRKYENYSLQDPGGRKQGHAYDYLLDTNCNLGRVEDLKMFS